MAHSDHAAEGSVEQERGGEVLIMCDLGYTGGGIVTCGEDLTFNTADVLCVSISTFATSGEVLSHQKISNLFGGFTGIIDDSNSNLGFGICELGDVDGDSVSDILSGAVLSDAVGAVFVMFLERDGSVLSHQKITSNTGGFTGSLNSHDYFGIAAAGIGDLNGDLVPDVAITAFKDDDGSSDNGAVYIMFLTDSGTVRSHQKIGASTGGLTASLSSDYLGRSVSYLGHMGHDGDAVLAIGSHGDDEAANNAGTIFITTISSEGRVTSFTKVTSSRAGFTAVLASDDWFGMSNSPLVINPNDNALTLAVGAGQDNDGGSNVGAIYIIFMLDYSVLSHQKISALQGGLTAELGSDSSFSRDLGNVGDLNLDGVSDLIVGAPNDGAAFILFLQSDGLCLSHRKISLGSAGFTAVIATDDSFGYSVAAIGDLNGDSVMDFAAGAINDDDEASNSGAIYVMFGAGNHGIVL